MTVSNVQNVQNVQCVQHNLDEIDTPKHSEQSSEQFIDRVLRPNQDLGPHEDLIDLCEFLEPDSLDESVADPEFLYELAENFKTMLEDDSRSERLLAAQEVLHARPESGLAHLILAREGSIDDREAESHYEKAVTLLKDECTEIEALWIAFDNAEESSELESKLEIQLDSEPCLLETSIWELAQSERCRFLWKLGKFDYAVDEMLQLVKETQKFDIDIVPVLVSWLIQLNRDEEAANLLSLYPANAAAWHYMNALLLFRREGNTPLSRAALAEAMTDDDTFEELVAEEHSSDQLPVNEIVRGLDLVIDITPAWQSSGAIDWLRSVINQELPQLVIVYSADEGASKLADPSRFKRWKDLFDRARLFIERKDWKEAKRSLKAALKEAERFGPGSEVFGKTIHEFISVLDEADLTKDDAVYTMRLKVLELRHITAHDSAIAGIIELAEIAEWFFEAKMYQEAVDAQAWASERCRDLVSQLNELVDLSDLQRFVGTLGLFHHCLGQFAEAESCYKQSLDLQSQYLGDDHPALIAPLVGLALSLAQQGKLSELAQVKARVAQLSEGEFCADDEEMDDERDDIADPDID